MFPLRRRPRGGRNARFLWQILLVVPPVVILSAIALYSLRQDRTSIEQDARRNAGVLAPELVRRFGERISSNIAEALAARISGSGLVTAQDASGTSGTRPPNPSAGTAAPPQPVCGLVLDGRIRLPGDYPALPSPPAWLTALTDAEASQWRVAAAAAPQPDLAAVRRAVAALAGAPAPVRANAEWVLARAEAARDGASQADQRLAALAARYPDVLSESGTPLADLALLLAMRRSPAGRLPDSLVRSAWTRMLEHPSFMTPALIEDAVRRSPGDASVTALDTRWRANELALDLLRRLPADGLKPGEIVLEREGEVWIALITALEPARTDFSEMPCAACHVLLVPASFIEHALRSAVTAGAEQLPNYASAAVRLGDWVWHSVETRAGSDRRIELASASGRVEVPLLVPSDAVHTFAADLSRIAPNALPAGATPPDGPARLVAPSTGLALAVGVDLADPDTLYASYRRRFWLAMGLILAATVAALTGLASTWQAFQRQRRLSEMKSNFVASVSHELRAPIAAVRLMTESLERGTIERGERQQEYLRTIVQECRRLSSLVENVLDFSRIDQGRSKYVFEPADVRALVSQTVELMQPYAAERQIALVHAAPPAGDALERRIDREAIQQALVNLIDNAIKHSPAGAEVTIGIEPGADEGAPLRLFVEDRGPGIPADDQERIFEPFYRRGSELRRETRGIGIGLSIVKHIAEAHGGRVLVQSSPGTGSRFTIELPFAMESRP